MKIKDDFMLRKVADTYVVVPVGTATAEFRGMINLNSAGAFLWKALEVETTEDEVVAKFLEQYEIDEATARRDVSSFINELKNSNLFE